MERREFISTGSIAAIGALMTSSTAAAEDALSKDKPLNLGRAFSTEVKPTPLPFNPRKLTKISEKMIQSHWENNYMASVRALNGAKKKLVEVSSIKDTPPFLYNGLKREHLMRTGSVVFHNMYFGNLGGSGKPGSSIQKNIANEFGSFENWESEFRRVGLGLGGGSGWVVFGYNIHLGLFENYWSADHMHAPAATIPLLVMDMYEHSYQIDYGAQTAKYVDAFFQNINWEEVSQRFERAKKIGAIS
jgi:superoxide dismutase, Fe-Mn family